MLSKIDIVYPKKENGSSARQLKCYIVNDFPSLRDETFG